MIDLLQIGAMAFAFFGALAALAWVADHANLTQPEPETERPPREDPIDFTAALKQRGPLPSWETTRRRG